MSAGAVTSIDNNMSFGLLLHGYENVSKRNLGNKNDPWFLGAAATVDILSLGIGMEETYRGAGMLLGGSAIAPETGGVTLTISGFGAAAMVHGIATTSNAVSNFRKDSVQFIEALGNGTKTDLKGGDKTPSGAELSYHAADQANERRFTLKNINDIILNNKKTRKKKFNRTVKSAGVTKTNEEIPLLPMRMEQGLLQYIPIQQVQTMKNIFRRIRSDAS